MNSECLLFFTKLLTLFSWGWVSLHGNSKVATLHPMITHFVEKIGVDNLEIISLGYPGMAIHKFEPSPKKISKLENCQLILAMGMGLEPYLGDLKASLQKANKIISISDGIPSLHFHNGHVCNSCGGGKNPKDPHWWHNVRYTQQVVKNIERALVKTFPLQQKTFQSKSKEYRKSLEKLHYWVQNEIKKIPPEKRTLVTAHAAFSYLCFEYRMEPMYLQGISPEGEISSKKLAENIRKITEKKIPTLFPEVGNNLKILSVMAKETHSKLGKPLYAEGTMVDYETMIRHNINAITEGLQ